MNIRPAQQSDVSNLSKIWYQRITLVQQTDSYFTLLTDAMQIWKQQASLWIDNDAIMFYVGERESAMVGYVVARVVDAPVGLSPQQMGQIIDMGLDLHRYHSGLGRLLIDKVTGWLHQQEVHILTVTLPARYPVEEAFWRSIGAKLRFNEFWMMI